MRQIHAGNDVRLVDALENFEHRRARTDGDLENPVLRLDIPELQSAKFGFSLERSDTPSVDRAQQVVGPPNGVCGYWCLDHRLLAFRLNHGALPLPGSI
jgi:hypothetical protein